MSSGDDRNGNSKRPPAAASNAAAAVSTGILNPAAGGPAAAPGLQNLGQHDVKVSGGENKKNRQRPEIGWGAGAGLTAETNDRGGEFSVAFR